MFIGARAMGGAIITGLLTSDASIVRPIVAVTGSSASATKWNTIDGVTATAAEHDPDAARTAAANARVLFLAVKPWLIHDVVREISDVLQPGTIVVSIAGAVRTASIETLLPARISLVRLNPSTPIEIGRGTTVFTAGAAATPTDAELVERLISPITLVARAPEAQFEELTFITGGGPAYLFYFAEKFVAAAERLGFTPEEARRYVQSTISGAAALLDHSEADPETLRRNVTSPKGITEHAIDVFDASNWDDHFDQAAKAYIDRAYELADDLDGRTE